MVSSIPFLNKKTIQLLAENFLCVEWKIRNFVCLGIMDNSDKR